MEAVAVHPSMSTPAAGRRWVIWSLVAGVVVALAAYLVYARNSNRSAFSLEGAKWYTAAPMELQVTVEKDGELQAVNNIDVACMVEGGSTIVEIVKEGAVVKKGDKLVELDSSLIKQKMEDANVVLESAKADAAVAKEMLDIQEGQNAANLEAAEVDLELARLALKQYTDGTYPQDLENAKVAVEMAKITVDNKDDDLRQTRELYSKTFVTLADVKSAELALTTVKNDLAKAEKALEVLQVYTHQMDEAAKKSYLAQAEQKLVRTKKENASNLAQKKADYNAKSAEAGAAPAAV